MALEDIELESSFLVLARNMGQQALVKTWGSLILGGDDPILVDTGASSAEIMQRLGISGWISEEQKIESQLARTIVMQRRALEHSVSGLMTEQHPAEYVKYHADRLHTPGALRLLDIEPSGPVQLVPASASSTQAAIHQIVAPLYQMGDYDPQVTGNSSLRKREEKTAVIKALNSGSFVASSAGRSWRGSATLSPAPRRRWCRGCRARPAPSRSPSTRARTAQRRRSDRPGGDRGVASGPLK